MNRLVRLCDQERAIWRKQEISYASRVEHCSEHTCFPASRPSGDHYREYQQRVHRCVVDRWKPRRHQKCHCTGEYRNNHPCGGCKTERTVLNHVSSVTLAPAIDEFVSR